MAVSIDDPVFVKALATQKLLETEFATRDLNNIEYDKIMNLDWEYSGSLEGFDTVIPTVSPSIRNRILGMKRLLDGTDVITKVSSYELDFDADSLERSLNRWFRQSSKLSRKNILSDMALSALLYGEIQVGLDNTKTLSEQVADSRKARAKDIADKTPFLIKTWHPNQGRYHFDDFGLTVFTRKIDTTWGAVQDKFGNYLTPEQQEKTSTDTCELVLYWDLEFHLAWVDGIPLYKEVNKSHEIPVEVQLVDGSQLYSKIEDQRQAVLYSVSKAGYFDQQCQLLTLMASIIFAMGMSPMYRHQLPPQDENRKLHIDYSIPGFPVDLLPGETYEPIDNRGLIGPAVRELYMSNERAIEQATIYDTGLGAPVESNIAFSTVSLLAQQSRLPLSGPQHALSSIVAATFEMLVRLLKTNKTAFKANGIDIDPSKLPPDFEINVTVDIKLPQDKLQLANIAHLLKGDGLVDDEWLQSNILNITDTTQVNRNIIKNKLYTALSDAKIAALVQEYIASIQGKLGTPPPSSSTSGVTDLAKGQAGQPAPMGGIGQAGQPPEEMLGMAATGTPPEGLLGPAAQGGMLPSQGRNNVPMEGML